MDGSKTPISQSKNKETKAAKESKINGTNVLLVSLGAAAIGAAIVAIRSNNGKKISGSITQNVKDGKYVMEYKDGLIQKSVKSLDETVLSTKEYICDTENQIILMINIITEKMVL